MRKSNSSNQVIETRVIWNHYSLSLSHTHSHLHTHTHTRISTFYFIFRQKKIVFVLMLELLPPRFRCLEWWWTCISTINKIIFKRWTKNENWNIVRRKKWETNLSHYNVCIWDLDKLNYGSLVLGFSQFQVLIKPTQKLLRTK